MKKRVVILGVLAMLSICSCSSTTGNSSGKSAGDGEAVENEKKFPFVTMPKHIADRSEALKYMVMNFWKAYFMAAERDTSYYSIDSAQFERAYANYAALLNMVGGMRGESNNNPGIDINCQLIAKSQKQLFSTADSLYLKGFKLPLMRLIEYSEKYLYDPNSPYLNENTYIPVLEAILDLKGVDDVGKLSYRYQLKLALLNRTGTKANDFEYAYAVKRGGGKMADSGRKALSLRRNTLYKIHSEYLLIYFNNPDCNSCKEQQKILMSDPKIEQMCKDGTLTVLAMYIDEQTDLWEKNYYNTPDSWIYARDPHLILRDNGLYGIRAIPSMYLLDREKRVLLKDASAQQIMEYMRTE